MQDIADIDILLVKTRNNSLSLNVRCVDGSMKALHSLYDPEGEAQAVVDAFQFDGRGILIVLGLGLGYHLKELVRRFPGVRVIVVEASPEIFETAKEHGETRLNPPFAKGEIEYIVGLPTEEVLALITKEQMRGGISPLTVFPLSSAVSAFPDYYNPILSALKKTVSVKLWERLRYPKFKGDAVKVALIDFSYFLTKEVERAIKRLGHQVVKFPMKKGEEGDAAIGRLMESILEFKPDFFLTINHLGFDEEGELASFFKSIEMPAASWYVDSPNIIIKGFERNASPYVSIFLWERGYIRDMEDFGFEGVAYLPLATDEEVFRPLKLSASDIKRYNADVGFAGTSMVKQALDKLKKVRPELRPVVEKAAGFMSSSRMAFVDAVKASGRDGLKEIESLTIQERLDFEAATLWKATLLYRLSCINVIRPFRPIIHGDDGWKELLSGDDYRLEGVLHYYKELPVFYNACKVSFNATSLQMGHAVNQRVFDVPACGGFLITDYQAAIDDLFEVGKEVITYRDKEEIPDLVRFYLQNPDERKTVAMRARERVLKEHTYKHRIKGIIQIMKERYA